MAYLAFAEPGMAAAARATASTPPAAKSRLTALEWSVVAIARRDGLSSLRMPGRMATALGAVFGQQTNRRLADPRLEALRRIAVLGWHWGYRIASVEIRAFLQAGFSPDQYELVVDSINAARTGPRTGQGDARSREGSLA